GLAASSAGVVLDPLPAEDAARARHDPAGTSGDLARRALDRVRAEGGDRGAAALAAADRLAGRPPDRRDRRRVLSLLVSGQPQCRGLLRAQTEESPRDRPPRALRLPRAERQR